METIETKETVAQTVPRILLVIPAYNESENIERVVENLRTNYPQYDYLVVNDCSTDTTGDILRGKGYNHLSLPLNLGIGGAVQSGYLYGAEKDYDVVIQIDGDGQHDPAYVKDLVAPIVAGEADMVIGSRFLQKKGFQTSFLRRMGIGVIRGVIKLCCGVRIKDTTSGFRATSKELTRLFAKEYAQDYPEPEAIVLAELRGYRVKEVPVEMNERMGGRSSINALRSVYYMIKVSLALILARVGIGRRRKRKS